MHKFNFFIILILVSLPFNSIPALMPIGELSHELWFYISLTILPFFIKEIYRGMKFYKSKELIFIIIFFLWIYISLIVNIFELYDYAFKNQMGIYRFITQNGVLIYLLVMFFIFRGGGLMYGWNKVYNLLLKSSIISFNLVFIYIIFEIFQEITIFSDIKNYIDFLIRDEQYLYFNSNKLRSVTFESPFLGYYLSMVLPFFLYLTQTSSSRYGFFLIYLTIFATIVSNSRFAMILLFIEILLFVFLLYWQRIKLNKVYITGMLLSIMPILIFAFILILNNTFNINNDSSHSTSNITRFSTAYALFYMFLDNPFFGLGLGQAGFVIADYYPNWAYSSYEINNYIDPLHTTWPPLYNAYLRLLAETGIGGIIFILLSVYIFYKTLKLYQFSGDVRILSLVIYSIACILSFMQFDTMRVLNFWILIAIVSTMSIKNYTKG